MAGVASRGSGDSSAEALAEWRSSEQLDNGTPSTSPPFWDTDDDDEDSGLRPSQLYGDYTWRIAKFSQINKRELRSDAFEAGGFKWYILIYPQGCDVCNHLSLFLCVANHEKLLPGWSHFAQFTIAVENSDPKKSKFSDTLHRFWKKEHDWGWKKFMELTKVLDGFVNNEDTLTIKAQVQVIREKVDRPFRCLARIYRKELVRVYLSSVELNCRRFVEERRSTLGKLIEDKARWSSFCAFWLGIDQKSRRNMTRERTDSILRVVVKQFFIEKEVTSTLVMDSLHSGLKALENQIKTKKSRRNLLGSEKLPVPVVHIDQDMFVLVDDVLLLLERAALEPLPPKDDKGPQSRMKDGSSGADCSDESLERDLRRLTELGRRTIEIFVLDHIFSKIEVAYQEAVALKRQEELIREEAAWLETEQKSKRGAAEKEKKSKKKQGKQKRNNRRGKDKGRDDNTIANALDKLRLETPDESKYSTAEEKNFELERPETYEDVSDVSDTVDHATEVQHLDSEEKESSPTSGGGATALYPVQNGECNGSCTVVDDSSSTCSTDSVPSVVMNGFLKANSLPPNQESHRSPTREKNQQSRATSDMSGRINEGIIRSSDVRRDVWFQNGSSGSRKPESEPKAATESLQDKLKKVDPQLVKGQLVLPKTESSIKDQAKTTATPSSFISSTKHTPSSFISSTKHTPSSFISSTKHTPFPIQPKLEPKITSLASKISIKKPLSDTPQPAPSATKSADATPHNSASNPKPTEKPLMQEIPVIMSRPSSAPIVPGPRPSMPVVSMVQSPPLLSRSVSAVGRLSPDPTSSPHHHQSYRNAMMGTNVLTPPTSTSSGYTPPIYFGPTHANSIYQRSGTIDPPSVQNDVYSPDLFNQIGITSRNLQSHGLLGDEFPHLDIINDLLDDEYGTSTSFQSFDSGSLNRQFSFPGDIGMTTNDVLLGPSTSSSRFQRTHSYHENGFQPSYSPFVGQFETSRDFFPQPNLRPYSNGQMNMSVPNQWQVASSDLSFPYHISDYISDYSNLAGNSNGYSIYRPSNGQ